MAVGFFVRENSAATDRDHLSLTVGVFYLLCSPHFFAESRYLLSQQIINRCS